MSISKAVLMGKVVRDPEKRFTSSNIPVTTFSINIPNKKNEGPNLVRVITWRNLADYCADNIHKGQTVVVDGKLQINSYTDSKGVNRKGIELDSNRVEIVSQSKQEEPEKKDEPMTDDVPPPSEDDFMISTDELIDEEEIPF